MVRHRGCVMETTNQSYSANAKIALIGCLHDAFSMPQLYSAPCDFSLKGVATSKLYFGVSCRAVSNTVSVLFF